MDMCQLTKLPKDQVDCIIRFIKEKRESPELEETYVNPLLREDILTLLDSYCTVIYYPVPEPEQGNNGFHVQYPTDRGSRNFVYINTNQTKEKQIFTAAHELGHIWRLEQYIQQELGIALTHDQEENVMNRFAAELLMPMERCIPFILRTRESLPHEKDTMRVVDILHLAAAIMNEYFVPYKSVVRRLFELNFLPEDSALLLLGRREELSMEAIRECLKGIARAEGYSRLFQEPDKRKWIEGLKELLDQAEERGGFPAARIEAVRKRFDLNAAVPDAALSNPIPLEEEKGADSDAETGGH